MHLVKDIREAETGDPLSPRNSRPVGNYHEALSISGTISIAVMKFLEKATQGRAGLFWLTGGGLTLTMVGEAWGQD